jgi:hypothetical protein
MKRRLLIFIIAAAILLSGLAVWLADRTMRAELLQQSRLLLQQARLVAQAVDIANLKSLAGAEADLGNPNYIRLKKQLIAVRSANAQCRFLYLMGRTIKGEVYFIVDSEATDSKDYSPPGQVYEEVPESYRRVFDTKTGAVEGPASDRWGTWVSALIPLADPQTGAVVAVLGMDVAARAWKWDIAARAAVPVGLLLLLIIGLTKAFVSARRFDAAP